ncbi:unnamed protein product [Echinostoma caproni]|uniref:Gag-pol polyprotein n=1 Tax=Echinostoma caproni TaxID=27848 RepID=A0A183B8R6_9TREM|nr:unnamed protein product [Echinostoma caproni]
MLPNELGYSRARDFLKGLLGQLFHVARTLIYGVLTEARKMRIEPEVLVPLVMKMRKCFNAPTSISYEKNLNALHTLEAIERCLPDGIQKRWADEVVIIGRLGREPNFTELTEFIRNRAKIASSRFGPLASKSRREERNHAKERTYDIPGSSRNANNYATVGERGTHRCLMCRSNHELSECEKFVQLGFPDRWEAAKRHGA